MINKEALSYLVSYIESHMWIKAWDSFGPYYYCDVCGADYIDEEVREHEPNCKLVEMLNSAKEIIDQDSSNQ